MQVKDIMNPSVRTASPGMTLAELDRLLLDAGVGGVAVLEGDKVVGVVSRSDIVKQARVGHTLAEYAVNDVYRDVSGFGPRTDRNDPAAQAQIEQLVGERFVETQVAQAMVTRLLSVGPDAPVEDAARLIADEGVHRVLVMDGDELVGIVTATDIVRLVADGRLTP